MPRKIIFAALFILMGMTVLCFTSKRTGNRSIEIRFSQVADDARLEFGKTYTNRNGQPYTVTKLMYYISNIHLEAKDGFAFADPNSYYLVDASSDSTARLTLKNVPAHDYISISFLVGVDSLKSTEQSLQEGPLDPMNGMYWTWNTGYIFFKLEGKSPLSKETNHELTYHIGGYKKPANCIQPIKLFLGEKNICRGINIVFDLGSFLDEIDLSKLPSATTHLNVEKLADAYQQAFSLKK